MARTAGAADAVQVGLLVVGALVVDDVRDVVDVDAAGGDVRGDEHIDLAGAERAQRLLACALAEIAVHRADSEAALGEVVAYSLCLALGAREDHGELAPVGLQDAGEQLDLVHRVDAPHVLLDRVDSGVLVAHVGSAKVHRLRHVAAGEIDDLPRHGGGEEHGLALRGDHRDDALDIGQEAHVEHLVGLIEHEHLDMREVEVATVGEVDDAARGADDDVDAVLQGLDLRLVRAAAVDGQDADALDATGALDVGGDLESELAGRADDQGLGLALGIGGQLGVLGLVGRDHPLQQRDAEAERLAGACLGLSDEVGALQGQRDALLLDGEGVGDAVGLEGLGNLRIGAQLNEGGGGSGIHGGGFGRRVGCVVRCCVAQGVLQILDHHACDVVQTLPAGRK